MIKHIIIIFTILAAFLLCVSCKTRKVDKVKSVSQVNHDSTGVTRVAAAFVDTSKKSTKATKTEQHTQTTKTKVYPTKGKPLTIKNGDTYTGEIDSAITERTTQGQSSKQTDQVEHKAVYADFLATDSTVTKGSAHTSTEQKHTDSEIDIMKTLELAGVILVIGAGVFAYWRFKIKPASAIVNEVKSVI